MRVLWTLLKVVIGLAIVLPISIIALVAVLGVLGALLGLAILVLKVAVAGVLVWGGFKLLATLVRGRAPRAQPRGIAAPAPVDRYEEAALRELDLELGEPAR